MELCTVVYSANCSICSSLGSVLMVILLAIIEEIDRAYREEGRMIGFTEAKETVEINNLIKYFYETLKEI